MTENTGEPDGIYIAARDYPRKYAFFPTAYLVRQDRLPGGNGGYAFAFTGAAKEREFRFMPEKSFLGVTNAVSGNGAQISPNGWDKIYKNDKIPPPFCYRMFSKQRGDYQEYLEWLDLTPAQAENPFLVLARSQGIKSTDGFETFAVPKAENGKYDFIFPLRGARHLHTDTEALAVRLDELKNGEFDLRQEPNNGADKNAVALHLPDGTKAGYCPRAYSADINALMDGGGNPRINVYRVNHGASPSLVALCRLTCQKPDNFRGFCKDEDYMPLAPEFRQLPEFAD